MIDRDWLEAFATGKPTYENVALLQKAIRGAVSVTNDDVEGDDEHVVFVAALVAALGLKRPTGRRPNKRLAHLADALSRFRHWEGRHCTHGQIARALAEPGIASETTIRNHLRTIDKRRATIHALLASDVARNGTRLLAKLIQKGPPKRASVRRSSLKDVPRFISADSDTSDDA